MRFIAGKVETEMADDSDPRQARGVWTRRGFVGALGLLAAAGRAGWAGTSPESWRAGIAGRSVARGEPDYPSWRQAMPWQMYTAPRYPDLIVRPESAAAVPAVLREARGQGLMVAIKSGGHNVSESFLRQGGLLLDLGELQGIEVDPAKGTAWVEPALWSHGLLRAIEPAGWAFPIAHCATVPMGGYLLGGGLGYNHDNWGTLACDSILAAEVTLASGQTVIANERDYPDLYWALRGSGTGFPGVVRRYKLRLFPAPDTVMESSFIYPLSRLQEATDLLQAWAAAKPRDTELMMLLAHSPVADNEAPPLEQKVCIVRAVAYCATREAATATLGGLSGHSLTAGAVLKNELVPTSLRHMQEESVDTRMGLGFALPALLIGLSGEVSPLPVLGVLAGEWIDRAEFYLELTPTSPEREMVRALGQAL